jgi:hypothetical protein
MVDIYDLEERVVAPDSPGNPGVVADNPASEPQDTYLNPVNFTYLEDTPSLPELGFEGLNDAAAWDGWYRED